MKILFDSDHLFILHTLKESRNYIAGAYECAFPDAEANSEALFDVDNAIQILESISDEEFV